MPLQGGDWVATNGREGIFAGWLAQFWQWSRATDPA